MKLTAAQRTALSRMEPGLRYAGGYLQRHYDISYPVRCALVEKGLLEAESMGDKGSAVVYELSKEGCRLVNEWRAAEHYAWAQRHRETLDEHEDADHAHA